MDTTLPAPITLTSRAVAVVKQLLQPESETPFLRVGVKGGGCSGMAFMLGFDARLEDDDLFEIDGIPVIIKKAHSMYLSGKKVDYQENEEAAGFTFM
ncbi:HesB/IscA family protein [Chitinophaga solisilvae]|uniref:Iron-sulfur cluster assembly accessory protein n=1 Tax=Chitinophaga solisilvae TaxID=1233460 RepID=A0A433W9V0_9BACT|nr:iron-sulfur cluster assembly accessory protein [Chitinophaga solisilvae]NSL91072.1 iron-sulfur cluster assembly accessory protein [Chitinophaga solisilvae]